MTQKQLEKLCRTWQKRLRLQDWEVNIRFVGHSDIDGMAGRTAANYKTKFARVAVCHPSQIGADWLCDSDIEATLVHELLHLHFPLIPENETELVMLEQGIDCTALALVAAYKNGCQTSQRTQNRPVRLPRRKAA